MEPEALGYCTSGLRSVKHFPFLIRVFRWKDTVTRAYLNPALLTHLVWKPNLSSSLLISTDESPAQHSSAVRMLTMRTMDKGQCIQSSEQPGSSPVKVLPLTTLMLPRWTGSPSPHSSAAWLVCCPGSRGPWCWRRSRSAADKHKWPPGAALPSHTWQSRGSSGQSPTWEGARG